MAEFVQARIENTISELEQMERIQLFTKEEIRLIANKRKRYEYKMQRRTKVKDDYLRYIQYELDLLKLIRQRRKKIRSSHKRKEIEYVIQTRVTYLFGLATQRFKSDVKLWISHIKFCQNFGKTKSISRILVKMLAVHSNKPKLWTFAAKWEWANEGIEGARKLMLRGLRFHPKSKLIYTAYFDMELNYANTELEQLSVDKTKPIPSDRQIRVQQIKEKGNLIAGIIFSSALNDLEDVQFARKLFLIAQKYSYAKPLRKKILAELKKKFSNDEFVYDLEAKHSICIPLTVMKCRYAYSTAIKEVPTERMWTLYLEAVLSSKAEKENEMTNELTRCHQAGLLNTKFYPRLIELLLKDNSGKERALKIVLEAISRYPTDAELRKMCIEIHLKDNKGECAMKEFEAAEDQLGIDNLEMLPLYMHVIQYLEIDNAALAEKFFKKGVLAGPNVSAGLKPCYLQWINDKKGINEARKEYAFMNMVPPLCLKLHTKMIELEMAQTERDIKIIRRCYELACQQFGIVNSQIWLKYIKFETESGEAKRVSGIFSRAKGQLKAEYLERFMLDFVINRTNQ